MVMRRPEKGGELVRRTKRGIKKGERQHLLDRNTRTGDVDAQKESTNQIGSSKNRKGEEGKKPGR